MSEINADQHAVELLLPLFLQETKTISLADARNLQADAARAWRSARQANWLAEEVARATHLDHVLKHLQTQGPRWADAGRNPRLHETLALKIGDQLQRDVLAAMQAAADKTAEIQRLPLPARFVPNNDWVQREQLALARFFIGALVAWRRIDLMQETEE